MKNEILNILESAKDENGCIPMGLVIIATNVGMEYIMRKGGKNNG